MLYGILLESCRDGICTTFGQETWKRIVEELEFEHETFTILGRYEENMIERIAECKSFFTFFFRNSNGLAAGTETDERLPIGPASYPNILGFESRFGSPETSKLFETSLVKVTLYTSLRKPVPSIRLFFKTPF
jgi:hypothetical protein